MKTIQKNKKKNITFDDLLKEYPEIDTKTMLYLLESILNTNINKILTKKHLTLNNQHKKILDSYIKRLDNSEPIAYIVQKTGFRKNIYKVNKHTLIPRMETELLVDSVLTEIIKRNHKKHIDILEVGTGTGAIAIELTQELIYNNIDNFRIIATDIDSNCLKVAKHNAIKILKSTSQLKHISFQKSDILNNQASTIFNLIISNPPYIPTKYLKGLEDSVKNFEPIIALDGDQDGLKIINKIINKTRNNKNSETIYFFEFDTRTKTNLVSLLKQKNAFNIKILKDQFNQDRFIRFQMK